MILRPWKNEPGSQVARKLSSGLQLPDLNFLIREAGGLRFLRKNSLSFLSQWVVVRFCMVVELQVQLSMLERTGQSRSSKLKAFVAFAWRSQASQAISEIVARFFQKQQVGRKQILAHHAPSANFRQIIFLLAVSLRFVDFLTPSAQRRSFFRSGDFSCPGWSPENLLPE